MSCPFIKQIIVGSLFLLVLVSCSSKKEKEKENTIVIDSKQMDTRVQDIISSLLESVDEKTNKTDDSTSLYALPILNFYYDNNEFAPIWSSEEKWKNTTDSMMAYLKQCEFDGLFKEDYQYSLLQSIKTQLDTDSIKRRDAQYWARADLLFTDAYVHLIQDLKQGRLQPDSQCWKYNIEKQSTFFGVYLDSLKQGVPFNTLMQSLQPGIKEYVALKNLLPTFLDSLDKKKYTYIQYPYKDSIAFLKKLLIRLQESGIETQSVSKTDSAMLSSNISNYQKNKGIKVTGKISAGLVSQLNNTGLEKFKRIAITLDKYKYLPKILPTKYIWVNLPSYYLQVWDNDTLALQSKIIIGKPNTPTPDISSEISDLVIYPTWTVPNSIIVKEILPGLKKNPDYLSKKGLGLFDNNGDAVDPHTVNWNRYTKGIPYFVRQNSGDNNALGVIKFNFNNPFSVYLHDTNQRYLFKNSNRSLSHGCVRVQDWQSLAFYIVRNDSTQSTQADSLKLRTDSITSWIERKEKHRVNIGTRLPVFIRYFGCEVVKGSIKFYEDIYNKDKDLREKYFASK